MEEKDFNIPDEELDAFRKWWNVHVPKQYITILKLPEYQKAKKAVETIVTVISQVLAEDDETAEYNVGFDALFGTDLGLTIIIKDTGLDLLPAHIKKIYEALPADYVFGIVPRTDGRVTLGFTFKNVKELIASEKTQEDFPDLSSDND